MDRPSHTDEETDYAEAQHKSKNIYNRGSKSAKETSLAKMDKPTYAYEEQNYIDVKYESNIQMPNKVERRPGLRSFDRAHPQENSQREQQSNFNLLTDNASFSAMKPRDRMTPSVEQVVSSEKPNHKIINKWAILVFLVAVIVGFSFAYLSPWHFLSPEKHTTTRIEETDKDSHLKYLRERFRTLRLLFSNQMERLWRVSFAAIRPLLDSPKHPAVILLAGAKRATATTDCVALRMSEAVSAALEAKAPVVVFNCQRYKDWEPNEVKREMDTQLTEAFQNGAKVGVVLAVDSLPGNSPMIFYRFCDTANAPFKNVALILTLNMEREATSDRDSEAHREMSTLWSPVLDPEQVDPLFSRIGNSVAYISEETDLSHCPKEE